MPNNSSRQGKQPTRWQASRWPLIIVGLLGGHVTLMMIALTLALSGPTQAVESDYYRKAQAHDQHTAAQRASDALGWSMTVTPAALADSATSRLVTLQLLDEHKKPINDAHVNVLLFHHATANEQADVQATQAGQGVYRLNLPSDRRGVWELRTSATRGEDRFIDRREVMVAMPEGGVNE